MTDRRRRHPAAASRVAAAGAGTSLTLGLIAAMAGATAGGGVPAPDTVADVADPGPTAPEPSAVVVGTEPARSPGTTIVIRRHIIQRAATPATSGADPAPPARTAATPAQATPAPPAAVAVRPATPAPTPRPPASAPAATTRPTG